MIKFYYDEEIDINKNIKKIYLSEITGYFLKGFTTIDILDKIFQTDNENICDKSNVDESNINKSNIDKNQVKKKNS